MYYPFCYIFLNSINNFSCQTVIYLINTNNINNKDEFHHISSVILVIIFLVYFYNLQTHIIAFSNGVLVPTIPSDKQ